MNSTLIIVIAIIVVVALALLFLVRGRKQNVTFSDTPPLQPKAPPAPKVEPTPEPVVTAAPEPVVPTVPKVEPKPEPVVKAAPDPVTPPPVEMPVATPDPIVVAEAPIVAPEPVTPVEEAPVAAPAAPKQESAADTLTQLKGLGPKAAAILNGLGVTRFDQIAGWNDADIAAIDAQMGAFKGRIAKDRWVDQARLLAKGDKAAFETEFGALGS